MSELKINDECCSLQIDEEECFLETILENVKNVCKISDFHVRLSSKLHLGEFFEIESLLCDKEHIKNFAAIGVRNILKKLPKKQTFENIVIVGYENYSTVLVQQIAKTLSELKKYGKINEIPNNVNYAIYFSDAKGVGRIMYYDKLKKNLEQSAGKCSDKTCFVTFVPITATQTTFYKIRNKIIYDLKSHYKFEAKKENFILHNCLVAVAAQTSEGEPDEKEVQKDLEKKYFERKNGKVLALTESKSGDAIQVDYQVLVETKWYNPNEKEGKCKLCEDNKVLSQVDKTETSLNMTFDLPDNKRKTYKDMILESRDYENKRHNARITNEEILKQENKKLGSLKGGVKYGHIHKGNNHHLYYLDSIKYFYEENENGKIDNWLQGFKIGSTEDSNIIISPLYEAISPFLNAVIDNVFDNNVHILQLDPECSYREDVRSKFNFIRNKLIEKERCDIKIYFVDDFITNSTSFNRAKTLTSMLMREWFPDYDNAYVFEKIFLLINRSSYDTIKTILNKPLEDFHAYLHLAVPSYNTERDRCPKCILQDKYTLLKKRSTGNILNKEFFRLEQKHRKIHVDSFENKEVRRELVNNKSNLKWLLHWYYLNRNANGDPLENDARAELNNFFENEQGLFRIEQFLSAKEGDYIFDIETEAKLYKFINDNIISQRNLHRLVHSHKLSLALENIPKESENMIKDTRSAVLRLMVEECGLAAGKNSNNLGALEKSQLAYVVMSYIKVASSGHLARHYHVRQAMLDIVSAFMFGMIGKDKEEFFNVFSEEDRKKLESLIKIVKYDFIDSKISDTRTGKSTVNNSIYPLTQYHFVLILLKRLASFQSQKLLDVKLLQGLKAFFIDLIDKYEGRDKYQDYWLETDAEEYRLYNRLTDEKWETGNEGCKTTILNKMMVEVAKLMKWSTMMTDDDSKCFRIADLENTYANSENCGNKNGKSDDKKRIMVEKSIKQMLNFLSVENSRLIYYGIQELCQDKINEIWNSCVLKERHKAICSSLGDEKSIQNMVESAFDENKKLLSHNVLSNFLKFYKDNNNPEFGKDDYETLSEMSKLFMLVYLLNENPKEKFYIYEDICNSICNILNYDNCYIVKKNNQKLTIVQQCSTFIDWSTNVFERLLKESYSKIIDAVETVDENEKSDSKDRRLAPFNFNPIEVGKKEVIGIIGKQAVEEKIGLKDEKIIFDSCCIKINCYSDKNKEQEESFYFILNHVHDNRSAHLSDEIKNKEMRNVLFLHWDISTNLGRDCNELMNFRDDFSQVDFVSKKALSKKPEERLPEILHITDIHSYYKDLKKNNNQIEPWNIDKNRTTMLTPGIEEEDVYFKRLAELYQKYADSELDNAYDLIAITGDLIMAGSTARMAEDNYVKASKIIFKIASHIWIKKGKGDKKRLRADWKKRIMIIPGNHDYSAMNDLETFIEDRQVRAKGVARQAGSAMAKNAYFIDFIRKRLDLSLDFIDDKLNYIRTYDKLNSTFICLNSCAAINPLRSNKVTLDHNVNERFARAFREDKHKKFILVHHTPSYVYQDMNYFVDKYDLVKRNESLEEYKIRLKNHIESLDNIPKLIFRNETIGDKSKIESEDLKKICLEYDEFFENEPGRIMYIRNTFMHDFIETMQDKLDYLEKFVILVEKIVTKDEKNGIKDKICVLGGHVHKFRENNGGEIIPMSSSSGIAGFNEVAKLLTKQFSNKKEGMGNFVKNCKESYAKICACCTIKEEDQFMQYKK